MASDDVGDLWRLCQQEEELEKLRMQLAAAKRARPRRSPPPRRRLLARSTDACR